MGDLAETVREGLLVLAVGAGLGVMQVMMQESVTAVCGPRAHTIAAARRCATEARKGRWPSGPPGGRSPAPGAPRRKATEVGVPAYELIASTELFDAMALQRMMAKLSTRRYGVDLESVGAAVEATARSTSKSAVSRRFVASTETALAAMLAADLSGLDLVALMIDGVHFADHLCVVALEALARSLAKSHPARPGVCAPSPGSACHPRWPARCAPPTPLSR